MPDREVSKACSLLVIPDPFDVSDIDVKKIIVTLKYITMGLYGISSKIGIYESDLKKMLSGQSSYGAAQILGIYESDLKKLLEGKASYGLAQKLGIYESDLQAMLNSLGKEGSIGFVIGLLLGMKN